MSPQTSAPASRHPPAIVAKTSDPNLIFEDWGLYITDSMVVTEDGGQPFTSLPRDLVVRE